MRYGEDARDESITHKIPHGGWDLEQVLSSLNINAGVPLSLEEEVVERVVLRNRVFAERVPVGLRCGGGKGVGRVVESFDSAEQREWPLPVSAEEAVFPLHRSLFVLPLII